MASLAFQLSHYVLGKVSKMKAAAAKGEDSQGNSYQSINEMWQREVKPAGATSQGGPQTED
jgi:hypothetical protein